METRDSDRVVNSFLLVSWLLPGVATSDLQVFTEFFSGLTFCVILSVQLTSKWTPWRMPWSGARQSNVLRRCCSGGEHAYAGLFQACQSPRASLFPFLVSQCTVSPCT